MESIIKKLKYICLSIGLLLLAVSCNDDIRVPSYSKEIVVDGRIEKDNFAEVFLTFSAPFFGSIDSVSIMNQVLTRAKVTVSSGTESEVLTLEYDKKLFPPFYYKGNVLKGFENKQYDLKVEYAGRIVTSSTIIPKQPALDSCWFEPDNGSDTLGLVWVRFNDNPKEENFYRAFTMRKNKDKKYVPCFVSTFQDKFFNGKTAELAIYRGNNNPLKKEDDIYFRKGDTISFNFCSVDRATFEFWESVSDELYKAGNPLASTNVRIKSNVVGGLGVWAGYGSVKKVIIAK